MTGEKSNALARIENEYRNLLRERGLSPYFYDSPSTNNIGGDFTGLQPDDQLRLILNAPYKDFASIGRETAPALLSRLAFVRNKPAPFIGADLVGSERLLTKQTEKMANIVDGFYPVHEPIYCGLYPTGRFNAQAMRTGSGGALVLMNIGAQRLPFVLFELYLLCAPFGPPGAVEPPQINEIQAAIAVADILNAHTMADNTELARLLPKLDRARLASAEKVAQTCEMFVLAHEYSHVLMGHLGSGHNAELTQTSAGALPLLVARSEQEFEADQHALELLAIGITRSSITDRNSPHQGFIEQNLSFLGVMIFFSTAQIVEAFRIAAGKVVDTETHPATSERMAQAEVGLYRLRNSEDYFVLWRSFRDWMDRLIPTINSLINDVNEYSRRHPEAKLVIDHSYPVPISQISAHANPKTD